MSQRSEADGTPITRREFTLESALALLSTVVITVSGCDDSNPPTAPSSTPPSSVAGNVSANHGHVAEVTGAQITAGTALSLNITGTATHPHTVEVTQADLMTLRNKQAVTKTSTTDNGHSHMITFTP